MRHGLTMRHGLKLRHGQELRRGIKTRYVLNEPQASKAALPTSRETRLNNTISAENIRKARHWQANKVPKTDSNLYAKDARNIVRDQLELKEKREREKATWEKQYIVAPKKCYQQTKKWRMTKIDKMNGHKKSWIIVMKKLLRYIPMYLE